MHSSPRSAGNLAQKFCILQNSNVVLYCDSVLPELVSLHLTSQIVLEGQLLQTQLLHFILKQKQGKVFYPVLLCCGTKLCDLYEMKKT